ncbi:hypothetical protein DSO57_1036527 [Entomophthora muscae]|uniref:Uncharacterized protein n=2 Tax=Entomophthora muscae TaxID=34485 RepID=A0ACC2SFP1_9FUNG|nr:hypothetical protein DSO57_1023679 [Entomophthora muscae]KAJ9063858.1 hypothetical protein DSO57_1036527 [Entomophthora muscae]
MHFGLIRGLKIYKNFGFALTASMNYIPEHFKACDSCRTRKVKCVRSKDGPCEPCQRRGHTCTFDKIHSHSHKLPSIQSLLREPSDARLDSLARLLDYRVASWKLEPSVPSLVLAFYRKAGPNNIKFPISLLFELLQESHMPDILPLILSAMDHHMRPSPTTTANGQKAIAFLNSRDSRLVIASLSIFDNPNNSLLQPNPLPRMYSPTSSEKSLPFN